MGAGSGKLHFLLSLLTDLMGCTWRQKGWGEGEGSQGEDAERRPSGSYVAGAKNGREWEGERIVLVSNFTSALDVIQVSGKGRGGEVDGCLAR